MAYLVLVEGDFMRVTTADPTFLNRKCTKISDDIFVTTDLEWFSRATVTDPLYSNRPYEFVGPRDLIIPASNAEDNDGYDDDYDDQDDEDDDIEYYICAMCGGRMPTGEAVYTVEGYVHSTCR